MTGFLIAIFFAAAFAVAILAMVYSFRHYGEQFSANLSELRTNDQQERVAKPVTATAIARKTDRSTQTAAAVVAMQKSPIAGKNRDTPNQGKMVSLPVAA